MAPPYTSLFQLSNITTFLDTFRNSHLLDVVPSRYPAPVEPDVFTCANYYSTPQIPEVQDCRIALDLLPQGTEGQPFSYHFNNDDPNRLPIIVSHGK